MSFKRRVLSALGKDVLLEIGRGLELDVTTRMGVEELRDALAKSKRAKLDAIVQESLSRDTLKDICGAVGLDDTGKEKAALVERILAAGGDKAANGAGYRIDPAAVRGSKATEGGGALGALLSGLDAVPAKKPTKAKGKTKTGERRRGGVPESEAVIAGTLKAALQQFALGAAGGYSGGHAHVAFTTHLLECFGWPAGRPDSAMIPHTFAIADAGKRVERAVALWWPERRTLLEVVAHDAGLDFAWKELVRVCLQLDPIPQYVVLTNQRDLQLYDLARDREAARLAIRIDDLPKYSEAFPFFSKEWTPGAVPRIVNVEKVSEDVADLVARLYRSVRAQHAGREKDVIRFTLQCITAMFAEDIGLLPRNYFTSLLYDGARSKDVERRLHELFAQMNTRDLPAPRVVPYFNGGLFTEAMTLPLGDAQLMALTKAAEANWSFVDPHIFGSVFQGIMNDDAERHASGAHYTAHDDIMRVVSPTIAGAVFAFLERQKLPFVKEKKASFDGWLGRWWQAWRPREGFARKARKFKRVIVCSKHAARPVFVFLATDFFPTHSLQLFAFDDDYSFGVLQSSFHWSWSLAKGSKIKADLRYTTEVWTTFPWPQDPGEVEVAAVAQAARSLRRIRETLMEENDWSLRALHQAAEVPGQHPLKDAQAALDAAVADAYGIPPDQGPIEFLLELNQLVAEDEQQGRKVRGLGLPDHLDPKDPRWFSTDCIEPPPVES
ncbi:MAG TPA: type IIL restriction-modification enzyme MmeI [Kofleriaceae bacterium]|nr:type IIL restriction-modification enzyme MmeI [Kofleriaceae bacterium]